LANTAYVSCSQLVASDEPISNGKQFAATPTATISVVAGRRLELTAVDIVEWVEVAAPCDPDDGFENVVLTGDCDDATKEGGGE
jgi:hypothetical protein